MKKTVGNLLARWGSDVEVCSGDCVTALRAVLTPTVSVSWQNMQRHMGDLGQVPRGQFLYLGSADISRADFLRCRGKCYVPRRCEEICVGGQTLYFWGLCVPAGEEAAWTAF